MVFLKITQQHSLFKLFSLFSTQFPFFSTIRFLTDSYPGTQPKRIHKAEDMGDLNTKKCSMARNQEEAENEKHLEI